MSTNPFQKVAGAKGRVNSEYFRAGRYLFYIRKFSWMKSRKDENLVLFECLTVQVLDPSAAAADPKGPHRVGDNATWCINMKFDASPGALKAAMRDIFGVSEEDVTEELCLMAAGDTQPLAGLYVEFDNKIIKTKEKGLPFTLCQVRRRWSASEVKEKVSAETLAQLGIDTQRADLPAA